MPLDSILFYLFALIVLGSAVMTITRRNVVHSAIWLIGALVGVAGLYLLQGAEFLAGVQIIVYVGGITVLFLFVIMLVPVREEALTRRFSSQKWVGVSCAAAVLVIVLSFVVYGAGGLQFPERGEPLEPGSLTENSEQVGYVLFSEYLLPFEMASILLLVAIVGAVVMSKTRKSETEG